MSQININLVLCEKCDDDFRNFYNIFDRIKEDDNHTASFVIVTLS